MALLLAGPCSQSDKAHGIGPDIEVVNYQSVILPGKMLQAHMGAIQLLKVDPDFAAAVQLFPSRRYLGFGELNMQPAKRNQHGDIE
jgi:hypothetical protein